MVLEGLATGTGLAALFTSVGAIIGAILVFLGILIRVEAIAILGAILLLIIINSIFGLPAWFIIVAIIVLGVWLLKQVERK